MNVVIINSFFFRMYSNY